MNKYAKVRSLMVVFDLLELCGERRREPNLPHISLADLTGKKKLNSSLKNVLFFSPDGAKTFKI